MPREQQLALDFNAPPSPAREPDAPEQPTTFRLVSIPARRIFSGIRRARRLVQRACDAPMLPLFDSAPQTPEIRRTTIEQLIEPPVEARSASGERAKARDILAAIRILNALDTEKRPATSEERQALSRFGGFGAVALKSEEPSALAVIVGLLILAVIGVGVVTVIRWFL